MEKIIYFNKKSDKTLGILTSLYITSLLANVAIGYRYITIYNIDVAGGVFIFPLSFMLSDIITEQYDNGYAKALIFYGVLCQLIFSLYIHFVIRMPYPSFWHNNDIYFKVMDPYLRFTFASATSIIIGSWLNIHFLSKWSGLLHGKYFGLRSLGSSFIGELFITIFSMLVANFGIMKNSQLMYMMICCFTVKTIISLIAVWPAAFVVCMLKNEEIQSEQQEKSNYFQKIILAIKNFSKPSFRLDKIDTERKNVSIYCRGARIVINKKFSEAILNAEMIHNMNPIHSAYIGYYFGLFTEEHNSCINFLLNKNNKPKFYLRFSKNKYTISSITRDGKINYYKNECTNEFWTQKPIEIYRNEAILEKFDASHACYIGILVGLEQKRSQHKDFNAFKLKLVSNNSQFSEK